MFQRPIDKRLSFENEKRIKAVACFLHPRAINEKSRPYYIEYIKQTEQNQPTSRFLKIISIRHKHINEWLLQTRGSL